MGARCIDSIADVYRAHPYNVLWNDVLLWFNRANQRNKLAIHAKRVIVKSENMRLLRDLWLTIDSTSSIGQPYGSTIDARKRFAYSAAREKVREEDRIKAKVNGLTNEEAVRKLTRPERALWTLLKNAKQNQTSGWAVAEAWLDLMILFIASKKTNIITCNGIGD